MPEGDNDDSNNNDAAALPVCQLAHAPQSSSACLHRRELSANRQVPQEALPSDRLSPSVTDNREHHYPTSAYAYKAARITESHTDAITLTASNPAKAPRTGCAAMKLANGDRRHSESLGRLSPGPPTIEKIGARAHELAHWATVDHRQWQHPDGRNGGGVRWGFTSAKASKRVRFDSI